MSKEWNFDIATDEMKFKMFKQLVDRNKELQKQLAEKDKEITTLKKALELACEEIDRNQGSLSDVAFDYFVEQAKESINESH